MRRAAFAVGLFLALFLVLAFLTLPIVAIFVHTSPRDLISSLGEQDARDALWLSLKTSLAALAIIVIVGTPAAYLLATREFRGRSVVVTLIELPLVLPRRSPVSPCSPPSVPRDCSAAHSMTLESSWSCRRLG